MKSHSLILGVVAAIATTIQPVSAAAEKLAPEQLAFFEKRIRPVLAEHCYKCHSAKAEKVKGSLLVDTKAGLLKGGSSGAAIVPGKPDKSPLIKSMKSTDEDEMMPPKGDRLSPQVIADFEAWVKMGAPDPRTDTAGVAALSVDWNKARDHWAYKPVKEPTVPKVKDADKWAKNDLDRHVLAKLESKGMEPSPLADKRTLLRRATFDLTGLPPTPQEVNDFLADNSAKAFEKVIDRLLASPAYGERWGRHWLDVARYADTSGDRNNNPRNKTNYPFAWTYRDYVIRAFNEDKPYDQFLREQIAGDRIASAENKAPLAAMGFLTVGKRFMGNVNETIDDRIDVITQGLMGVTAACARCHDHKFDPVSQKDYYSLHGVFASSVEPSEEPMLVKPKSEADYQDFLKKSEEIQARMANSKNVVEERLLDGFRNSVDKYLLGVRDAQMTSKTAVQIRNTRGLDLDVFTQWTDYLKATERKADPVLGPWLAFAALKDGEFAAKASALAAKYAADKSVNELVAKLFSPAPESITALAEGYGKLFRETERLADKGEKPEGARAELHALLHGGKGTPIHLTTAALRRVAGAALNNAEATERGKLDDLKRDHPGSPPRAMALNDLDRVRDSFVMIRGEPNNRGPVVKRRWLEIFGGSDSKPFTTGSGRLDLANEVANKDNPLTARVFVNRVWNWHFGDAIVRTLGDFGLRSDPPSNQELLDYVAARFMADGWSVKKLHKLIMLSATWQQTSQDNPANSKLDPGNALFWRQNLQRLDFESMRDTLLALGGKLDLADRGGPSDQDLNASDRRTVYGYIDRARIADSLRIFDFANPDMTAPGRVLTTVPLQALYLMNNGFVVEQARNVAARPELLSGAKDEEKVIFIYQLFFQRAPSAAELRLALDYIADQSAKPATGGADLRAWQYGYGEYDPDAKKLVSFEAFPAFLRDSWVIADRAALRKGPEPKKDGKGKAAMAATTAFNVTLNAVGGVPGDRKHSVVRRWVAPRDGVISIEGKLEHDAKTGDGVEAFAALATGGQLGTWQVAGKDVATNLKDIKVKRGDAIDFIVTSRGTSESDAFRWVPIIHMLGMKRGEEYVWNAQQEFSGPVKQKLETNPFSPWERLSQALLMSNELIYVN
jgi:cytochrome c553